MTGKMGNLRRTNMCGELRTDDISKEVVLMGWVQRSRNLGGLIFVDLRDTTGFTQIVFDETSKDKVLKKAEELRSEYVIAITGIVRERSSINYDIPTGKIEVIASELIILDTSQTPPIYIKDDDNVSEAMRLKYRYLDLRKPKMQENLKMRARIAKIIRDFYDNNNFIEVETPVLTKPTPEGARDYIVPSRVNEGKFFALPQSPQLLKQLLMVSGMDRYYQIVKCFRDEDLRTNRQPEFTQVDVEMSFVDVEDVIALNEKLIKRLFKEIKNIEIEPIKRMTYEESMRRFGVDKPDLRFGMELIDLTECLAGTEFNVFESTLNNGGVIKALKVEKGEDKFSRKDISKLEDFVKTYKAKGLAWIKYTKEGINSPIGKFISEEKMNGLIKTTELKQGDLLLIVADTLSVVSDSLGNLRNHLAKELELYDENSYSLLWITEFPLLEFDEEEKRFVAKHHPFTHPMDEDIDLLETNPQKVRAKAYDLVINGDEIGGGSIRINNSDLQSKMFTALGFSIEAAYEKFGFLLDAFKYGIPPHGGIALGLDRLVMTLLNTKNIRDVIAFPKTQSATDLMTEAPCYIDEKQLIEAHIKVLESE